MQNIDLVVVGAGPAGMAAALSAFENGVSNIVILERDYKAGGILNQCIHNGFGLHYFKEELTGPEYAYRFEKEVHEKNIEIKLNTMVLDISEEKVVTAVNEKDGVIQIKAKAIILAMGCRERTRGALNIPGSRPKGILTAGAAQRFVNIEGYMPGKEVVILGSGDIGLIMARRMTLEGAKVKAVCELMPYSGGLQRNIVQCLEDFNIPLKLSHTIVKVHGDKILEGVTIGEVDKNFNPIKETFEYIPCDTLLLSVGLIPENELSEKVNVDMDNITGGAKVNEEMETSIEGIFACGNVVHVHDLVDFVTLESQRAGRGAASYILESLSKGENYLETKASEGIRYIVPQKINKDSNKDKIQLFFRVKDIYKNSKIVVKIDDKVIKTIKKVHLAPGEMEEIIIDKSLIDNIGNNLTIQVEGE